jgi:5-methylcytosine-specific restriction endonuclease McrA
MRKQPKIVHVEIGPEGKPIRIFNSKAWLDCENTVLMDRALAVRSIREQVFERSIVLDPEEHNECEQCGRTITWSDFELNEIRPKGKGGGKSGGEVSLENCEALCNSCHQTGPDAAHKDRRWQTAKIKS